MPKWPIFNDMRSLLVVASLVLSACGGTQSGAQATSEPSAPTQKPAEPQSADDKLSQAQASTCAAVCDRLVQCSASDAKANLSPQQVAELNLEQTMPVAVDDCKRSCVIKPLSPKQLITARECVNGAPECPDYLHCLDAVNKGA